MSLKLSRSTKAIACATVVSFGEQDRLREPVAQQDPVGQTGQRVMGRHELDAVLGELALDGDARDSASRLRSGPVSVAVGSRAVREYIPNTPSTAPWLDRIGVDQQERSEGAAA